MRIRLLLACLAALGSLAPGARANPVTQDPCPRQQTNGLAVEVWKTLDGHTLENLLFADGELWISDQSVGVRRFLPDETELSSIPLTSPGGLVRRPGDGKIYAGFGNSAFNALTHAQAAGVKLITPGITPTVESYASNLTMANGLALDADGNLYASNDFDARLVKIEPGDPPTVLDPWSSVYGTNGLVISGDIYAAITFDQRSPIEKISLVDGTDLGPAALLTFGAISLEPAVHPDGLDPTKPLLGVKGLDDMTRDPLSGELLVVANGMGELLRVDPATGTACLITGGLQNPSSVRVAPAGSDFAMEGYAETFYVTEFSSNVRRIGWNPQP
jgi:hypothetical protein